MKTPAVIAASFFFAAPALANDKPQTPQQAQSQQEKFTHCAHESKGLKGEERNKFMSECLKGHEAKAHETKEARNDGEHHESQQGKMKACNDEARTRNLHGDERRAFMSACLKSSS